MTKRVKAWDPATNREHEDAFAELVAQQLAVVASKAASALGGVITAAGPTEPATPPPSTAGVSLSDIAIIGSMWQGVVTADLMPALAEQYLRAAGYVRGGIQEAFGLFDIPEVSDVFAENYLAAAANRLRNIGDQLWQHARDELVVGFSQGEGIGKLRDRVSAAAGVTEPRATVIARTEVIAASNAGSINQIRLVGLTGTKEWLATMDTRTRCSHLQADGQSVGIQDKFKVGGAPCGVAEADLDFPGDPTGPPEEIIQCRCSMAFDLVADEEPVTASGPTMFLDAITFESLGSDSKLREYWVHGEGAAKIRWGESGDFNRCVRHLGKYVRDPKGLCAEYHHEALGKWPGQEADVETVTAAAQVHTGAMIAFRMSEADAERLAVHSFEPADQLHCTVAYLGEASSIDQASRAAILELASEIAGMHQPITTETFSYNVFNPHTDGDTAVVLGVRGGDSGLVETRDMLASALGNVFEAPAQHTPWVPHVTIAYTDDMGILQAMPMRLGPITFDRIRVAFGGEVTDFPLGGGSYDQPEEVDTMTPDATAGAGAVNPVVPMQAWEGVIVVEDTPTGDGREFAAMSLSWPELPVPLMYQFETSHGGTTDRSVNVGNIKEIWRVGNLIYGRGEIDMADEYGVQAAHKIANKFLNGISIDADSVTEADLEFIYPDATGMSDAEAAWMSPELVRFHKARIRGATLCNLPAFVEASVHLIDNVAMQSESVTVNESAVVTASSHTITIPDVPPEEWFFEEPSELPPIGAIWVTDEGRLFGLVGPSEVAHRAFRDKRVTIPMGNVDYDRWMNRPTIVAGGARVATGVITMNCGHMPAHFSDDTEVRMAHYDNSCSIAAVARVVESKKFGAPLLLGAVMPMSPEDFQRFTACQISGDWAPHRERHGWREFVAALSVPVPGFARGTSTVRVDAGAMVASTMPIRIFDGTPTFEPRPVEEGNFRAQLARIRGSVMRGNRAALGDIRDRVRATERPARRSQLNVQKEVKMGTGCAPCDAKRAQQRQDAQTSAQVAVTAEGYGQGDQAVVDSTSQTNSVANTSRIRRG